MDQANTFGLEVTILNGSLKANSVKQIFKTSHFPKTFYFHASLTFLWPILNVSYNSSDRWVFRQYRVKCIYLVLTVSF